MTIDEVVKELKSENGYYANNGMCDVAEFNTMIIRWLEELKELRGCVKSKAFTDGYNKAIDDFKNKLILLNAIDGNIKLHLAGFYDLEQMLQGIAFDIAEQLKVEN